MTITAENRQGRSVAEFVARFAAQNDIEVGIEQGGGGAIFEVDDANAEELVDAIEVAGFPYQEDDEKEEKPARRPPMFRNRRDDADKHQEEEEEAPAKQPWFKMPKSRPSNPWFKMPKSRP